MYWIPCTGIPCTGDTMYWDTMFGVEYLLLLFIELARSDSGFRIISKMFRGGIIIVYARISQKCLCVI